MGLKSCNSPYWRIAWQLVSSLRVNSNIKFYLAIPLASCSLPFPAYIHLTDTEESCKSTRGRVLNDIINRYVCSLFNLMLYWILNTWGSVVDKTETVYPVGYRIAEDDRQKARLQKIWGVSIMMNMNESAENYLETILILAMSQQTVDK